MFRNPKRILLSISRTHLRWLFILTLLLALIGSMCNVPGIIPHPQFGADIHPDLIRTILSEQNLWWVYISFFVVDYIWAFLLLWAVWIYVVRYIPSIRCKLWIRWVIFGFFTIMVITAYVFDVVENYNYLVDQKFIRWIDVVKKVIYGVVLLIFLIVVLSKHAQKFFPKVLEFVKAAWFSLLILAIIGVLLPKAPQVNSIVVILYDSPPNLLFLLFFAPIFAIVLTHYPTYFNIDESKRSWYRANWAEKYIFRRNFIFGIIFYENNKQPKVDNEPLEEDHRNLMLRSLGVLFYGALFYFVGYTSEVNFDWLISISTLTSILIALGVLLLYILKKRKQLWLDNHIHCLTENLPEFYDGDYRQMDEIKKEEIKAQMNAEEYVDASTAAETKTQEDCAAAEMNCDGSVTNISKQVFWYCVLFSLTVLAHVVLIGFFIANDCMFNCEEGGYTLYTASISLICIVLQMATFIFYRSFRSVFRFTFFIPDPNLIKKHGCDKTANTKLDKPLGWRSKWLKCAIYNAFYIMRIFDMDSIKMKQAINDNILQETSEVTEKTLDAHKKRITCFFNQYNFIPTKYAWLLNIYRGIGFGTLSNNILFLQFAVFFGIFLIVLVLLLNFVNVVPFKINPIIVILAYLFLAYGFIVVIMKNFIYFKYSNEIFATKNKRFYYRLLIFSTLGIVALNGLTIALPNDLYSLPQLERDSTKEISLQQYVDSLPKNQTRYYIGAYGGGMKANAWALTVLNALQQNDPNFFDKTVAISGASGGTMGLINMAAILKNYKQSDSIQRRIKDISTENILSLDLTHLMGRDLLAHLYFPKLLENSSNRSWLMGKDRSGKAMERYAKLSMNQSEIDSPSTYRAFWKKIYEARDKKFPILISNTTNVMGNQGMAVSVRTDSASMEASLLYQGADNILEIQRNNYDNSPFETHQTTLSYYDAASTSNRFPFISPATKIESMGHYNDGGIYENSGMLSAYKLFRAVNSYEKIKDLDSLKQRNVFINIVNDKGLYIKNKVEAAAPKLAVNKVNKNTEINSILNSIASTEMMPIYVKTELKRLARDHEKNIEFITIYLPHTFSMADIKNIYGEDLELGEGQKDTYRKLYEAVEDNNKSIRDLIKTESRTPVIEPPMSRVISTSAYHFMVNMKKDSLFVRAMKAIKD